MENGYSKKLVTLREALESFEKALAIGLSDFNEVEADVIKSGQIQKFEVCVELFWKTLKKYLYDIHGLESISPKMVIKQFYQAQYVEDQDYERLIEMINDRNRLSHLYNEQQFKEIYDLLGDYRELMKKAIVTVGRS